MTTLINIDFLILNFKGSLNSVRSFDNYSLSNLENENPFTFELADFGTKIFSARHEVFYKNRRLGTCTSVPRSSIIDSDLIQFQLDNTFFYTNTLEQQSKIIREFTDYNDLYFDKINRLDIAVDKQQNYIQVFSDVIQGNYLISGRSKSINAYYETDKGKSVLNGFTIGKRNSSKFLRVYNKTLNLSMVPKHYITEIHKNFFSDTSEIWRFEYQLNSKFFTDLEKQSNYNDVKEKLTYGVFDINVLIDLLQIAEKNHFELTTNTGKSQVNKEQKVVLHNWSEIKKSLKVFATSVITKLSKVFDLTDTINKRTAKALFRAYYVNKQDILFIASLYKHLLNENLVDWFQSKYNFYISEFRTKSKLIIYNQNLFYEHKHDILQSI